MTLPSNRFLLLLCAAAAVAAVLSSTASVVAAFSSPSSPPPPPSNTSPWAPAEWRINLNIGREPGTYMPEDFGASGARLLLSVDVLVESETVTTTDPTNGKNDDERDFLGGTSGKADLMSVLDDDPTFVNMDGQQTVPFGDDGAWRIGSRATGKPGDSCRLRFYLDVVKNSNKENDDDNQKSGSGSDSKNDDIVAVRNDVYLCAERLYFTANAWRESELQLGIRRFRPIQSEFLEAQRVVDDRLSHDTGDRRLDGTNLLDTALASIDMAKLVGRRDDALFKLRGAERTLPNPDAMELSLPGHWPGSTEKLAIAKGKIAVRRKRKDAGGILFGGGDEFYILGTWTAAPLSTAANDDGDGRTEY